MVSMCGWRCWPWSWERLDMNFFARLEARVRSADTLLCVGLDPRATSAEALRQECNRLIDATSDYSAIYKLNSGFFEAFGSDGVAVLREVIQSVPDHIPVL